MPNRRAILRQQMAQETALAIAKAEIVQAQSAFHGIMDGRDEAFRRGVEARSTVMEQIEQNAALKKRMEEVYEEGRNFGFKQAGWPIIKSCMAGACLMLQEGFGMDEDAIVRGLQLLHEKIAWALTYSDLADEVLEKTGIQLQLDDPLEPVTSRRTEAAK